jgi:hypothetical protein
MYTERNGAAGVRGNRTVNFPISILDIGLWASHEPFKRHVLNILHPYILRDVWRPQISPNRHIILA